MLALLTFCGSVLGIVVSSAFFLVNDGTPDPIYLLLFNHWQTYTALLGATIVSGLWYVNENW